MIEYMKGIAGATGARYTNIKVVSAFNNNDVFTLEDGKLRDPKGLSLRNYFNEIIDTEKYDDCVRDHLKKTWKK